MTNKMKTTKATKIMMEQSAKLKRDAAALRAATEQTMEAAKKQIDSLTKSAKEAYHTGVIQSNRMEAAAKEIDEALDAELLVQIKEEQDNIAAWDRKPTAALNAQQMIELQETGDWKEKGAN